MDILCVIIDLFIYSCTTLAQWIETLGAIVLNIPHLTAAKRTDAAWVASKPTYTDTETELFPCELVGSL